MIRETLCAAGDYHGAALFSTGVMPDEAVYCLAAVLSIRSDMQRLAAGLEALKAKYPGDPLFHERCDSRLRARQELAEIEIKDQLAKWWEGLAGLNHPN